MLRSVFAPALILIAITSFINAPGFVSHDNLKTDFYFSDSSKNFAADKTVKNSLSDAYYLIDLDKKGLSKNAFDLAIKGYDRLVKKRLIHNRNIISIIDFSKSSSEKRLFVIDIKKNKLLFQSLVAHGRNSGLTFASSFSNEEDSHKSSLGFYVTLNTYTGDCGYSLKLKGCERGINDKAFVRSIVMHGSEYVTEDFLHSNGFLGRSFGCPALPEKISKKVIDVIKNGSCLFIYHPTKKYLLTSPILNG